MKTELSILAMLLFFSIPHEMLSNNIQVSNPSFRDELMGVSVKVSFDISWENSWRVTSVPSNWDAAWVFIKFRERGGVWRHAWLSNVGHESGSGTASTFSVGLKNDKLSYDPTGNPGVGVMVHRSAEGSGTFNVTGMVFLWNYGVGGQGLSSLEGVDIQVFAIEMVMIPEGPYWLGDSLSTGTFRQVEINKSYQVTTTGKAIKCQNTSSDDAQIKGDGIWLDGDDGVSLSLSTEGDMNPDYPTGYRGYYMMKYELSQGQYRDFLNSLTREQQNARTGTDISGSSITNRYVMSGSSAVQGRNSLRCDANIPASGPVTIYCDLDGDGIPNEENDGEWLACNFLNWNDGISYLDWSGLRPMTELEYEKAGRGPSVAIPREYAWGNTVVANVAYSLSGGGSAMEAISTNYSTVSGNASYSTTDGTTDGPLRVGIFSGNALNSGRISSGAGYYGAMELSGNLWEQIVTLGIAAGRAYAGNHGDGELSASGVGNEQSWPLEAVGSGFRGSSWSNLSGFMRISDRVSAAEIIFSRTAISGIRGCRSIAVETN